jgi:medium-chain acyl-[acyl-carrier-protein] hydrolase
MYTTFRHPLTHDRRLICLPYAGGGANIFRDWAGAIPGVDVLAARLPGRDSRFNEPPATAFEPLLDHLLDEIAPYLGAPFILFGHSMGGLLAYELGRRLEAIGRLPDLIVSSGSGSPIAVSRQRQAVPADDETLLLELRHDKAAPADILANQELMRLLLPILRADLDVVASYRWDSALPALRAPLRLYYGQDEVPDVTRLLAEWASAVSGPLAACGFPGGHFFVHTSRDAVLAQLAEDLKERPVVR